MKYPVETPLVNINAKHNNSDGLYDYMKREIERLKEENNILCLIANGEKEKEDKILELINRINKAKEYIEYYFVKGRTKNNKQFDLGLYEILTDKNLFFLTRKEVEQFFQKELRKSDRCKL